MQIAKSECIFFPPFSSSLYVYRYTFIYLRIFDFLNKTFGIIVRSKVSRITVKFFADQPRCEKKRKGEIGLCSSRICQVFISLPFVVASTSRPFAYIRDARSRRYAIRAIPSLHATVHLVCKCREREKERESWLVVYVDNCAARESDVWEAVEIAHINEGGEAWLYLEVSSRRPLSISDGSLIRHGSLFRQNVTFSRTARRVIIVMWGEKFAEKNSPTLDTQTIPNESIFSS